MDFVETDGETIDDAIRNALKTLGVERENVTVDVLSEGRKGIFGFGAQKARIRATLRGPAVAQGAGDERSETSPPPATAAEVAATAEKAKAALENILKLMGVTATVEIKTGETGDEIVLDVRADSNALLIGRKGQTLEDMALRLGEKAKRQRKTVTVDALSAADRRIIHAALQDDPWVTTRSLGQGSYRRLLIIPEGDRRNKNEPKPAGPEKVAAKQEK